MVTPIERPAFLVTIDTEGDNVWSRPRELATENARFLPRFQQLCEQYDLKPVYLTNWEMANAPTFQEFGRDVVNRDTGEIGMHLHAWNSPPIVSLGPDDLASQPYLIEYPNHTMREKIVTLTETLRDTFSCPITSHRAGRWAFDERYASMLVETGYTVDCSVTPLVSWRHMTGTPSGSGGSDYTCFPTLPYFIDLDDVSKQGESSLLEVPMTICPVQQRGIGARLRGLTGKSSCRLARRILDRLFPAAVWLRPNGRNLPEMLAVLNRAVENRLPCVEFMLHSSELMPGGSPRFRSKGQTARLYDHLEQVFDRARSSFRGCTLEEFRNQTPNEELAFSYLSRRVVI